MEMIQWKRLADFLLFDKDLTSNMALQHKTIDNYCRLCAIESQSGVIIYSTEGENLCLEEKIFSCLRIEVSRDDLLPKKVCHLCSELLEDYHRFSERAVQVQQTLGLLLGVHAPCTPSDEMQLCLMKTNVKLESSIKNELDELAIQPGSNHVENEKFDFQLGVQTNNVYQCEDQRKKLILSTFDECDSFREDFNFLGKDLGDSVRQLHRRKMAQPKKTASCGPSSEESLIGDISSVDNGSKMDTSFKSEDIVVFQDMVESNVECNEEDLEIEREWQKHWGITCNECQNVFPNKVMFDRHYQNFYNKEPVYTCSYCKVSIEKYSDYRSHTLKHIYEGQYKCEFCDKKFCMEKMLQLHGLTHTKRSGSFVCDKCGLECPTQKKLNSHKKKHNDQIQKEFHCPECGKILQTRGGLTAHLTVHKLGRRFMCHICGKTFTQKINMQQHVKHHRGEKPYSCENCGKSFTEKSHLNRHKSFHTLDRPFQCPVCKKMYKTERCLKVHSHVHLNTRPYVCSYCGKGFLSSTKLKQHYNCHTGERPFACKYCERAFTNYPNWLKHTRRRHKVDHKTGLSLKVESQGQAIVHEGGFSNAESKQIEFVEMPEVNVKDDADVDHVQSVLQQASPSEDLTGLQEFELNTVPDVAPQFPFQLTPFFKLSFKQI